MITYKLQKVGCIGRHTQTLLLKIGCCYPHTEPQGGLFRALFPASGSTPLIIPQEVRTSVRPSLGPADLWWTAEPSTFPRQRLNDTRPSHPPNFKWLPQKHRVTAGCHTSQSTSISTLVCRQTPIWSLFHVCEGVVPLAALVIDACADTMIFHINIVLYSWI